MLHVRETRVARARFPVIDIHAHLSWAARAEKGVSLTGDRKFIAPPSELLPVMDATNLHTMVNLTGGYGDGLREAVSRYDKAHPGRFLTFTEPMWDKANQPGYAKLQADAVAQAARDGARGLKVLKTLGLYLRENITSGPLVKVDDRRFDLMWEACAAHHLPVAIHVSDPSAFFLATDRYNERFEELNNHPDWSFHGRDFPGNAEILAARNRVLERHPKTQFITLHVGNFAENLANVAAALDKYPNMYVEIAARIGELEGSREPRAGSSTGIRTASFSAPMPCLEASKPLNRSSAKNSTKSTSASSKPGMNTSTMPPRPFRPRAAGASTASSCRIPSSARCTTPTHPASCASLSDTMAPHDHGVYRLG